MRVLHVLEAVGGGTIRHLADLVSATSLEHHVACPSRRSTDLSHPDPHGFLASAGATVHTLDMSRQPLDWSNAAAVKRLNGLIRGLRPDVVHAHASVAGAVSRVARLRGTPLVWTPHGVSDRRWVVGAEGTLRSRAAVVVALSKSEAMVALERRLAVPDRVKVIPNGLLDSGLVTTNVRAELRIPAEAPVLGFVGRLCHQKDPLTFVKVAQRVMRQVPAAHVLVVGSGPLDARVREAMAQLLPGRRVHHVVRDAGAHELLQAIDVLVTPSRYEGGPYLPLEAALAGAAVVSTDCVGSRDYVVHGISGLLAPVGDADALSTHAISLLENDILRRQLVRSAMFHVRSAHSITAMAAGYIDTYNALAPDAAVPYLPLNAVDSADTALNDEMDGRSQSMDRELIG